MFDEVIWREWVSLESKNYILLKDGKKQFLKKGYVHFDHRIWFPTEVDKIKKIISGNLKVPNSKTGIAEWHSFTPFIRMLLKTLRFRYQEEIQDHDLECKIRPICFASHIDSLILGYYGFAIGKQYEDYLTKHKLSDVVLAYRSNTGLSNIQHAKEAFNQVRKINDSYSGCTAIALDIKGYFDNIDHEILKSKWCQIIGVNRLPKDQFKIFEILTGYTYVNKKSIYKKYGIDEKKLIRKKEYPATLFDFIPGDTIVSKYKCLDKDRLMVKNKIKPNKKNIKGIPQGSAISALLSNIYLIDYDIRMKNQAEKAGCVYRRYCDDILIICPTERASTMMDEAISLIKDEYKLTIQKQKAEVIDFLKIKKGVFRAVRRKKSQIDRPVSLTSSNKKHYFKNLQYLGFEFNGNDIFIRSSSLSKYFRKMKGRLDKTVGIAYGPNGTGTKIKKKQIFEKYTVKGNIILPLFETKRLGC
jgi:RNA-directed DNA polymerase